MAAFLCATTTAMAAPVSVTAEQGYKNVNVKNCYHKKTNEGTYHKDASVSHVDNIQNTEHKC